MPECRRGLCNRSSGGDDAEGKTDPKSFLPGFGRPSMRLVTSHLARVRPSHWGCLGAIVAVSAVLAAVVFPAVKSSRDAARMSMVT